MIDLQVVFFKKKHFEGYISYTKFFISDPNDQSLEGVEKHNIS